MKLCSDDNYRFIVKHGKIINALKIPAFCRLLHLLKRRNTAGPVHSLNRKFKFINLFITCLANIYNSAPSIIFIILNSINLIAILTGNGYL